MTKLKSIPFLLIMSLIIFSSSIVFAQAEKPQGGELKDGGADITQSIPVSRHFWKIGPELSYIEYKEPDVMKEKGFMYGIGGTYSYHNEFMIKADAKLSYGQVDYQNSGTLDNIDDFMAEIRAVGGYDFKLTESLVLTPFIGIGYRYLRDDSSGRMTSDGSWGYLRESNYFYSPIGVSLIKDFDKSWAAGLTIEYDFFWKGKQKSYLSDVSHAYSNLENDQTSGYGLRGSFFIKKITGRVSYSVEPFIVYWNIDKSDIQTITYHGTIWGYGWEPKNNSTEIGLKFNIGF
ncbi:MAG: autotransporter outer membrane beta-barrel domain-containing protein [Smithella sp.]